MLVRYAHRLLHRGEAPLEQTRARQLLDVVQEPRPQARQHVEARPGEEIERALYPVSLDQGRVPQQHADAAAYLIAFADEIKSSGLLRTLIERHKVRGLSIAAPPAR